MEERPGGWRALGDGAEAVFTDVRRRAPRAPVVTHEVQVEELGRDGCG